MRLLLTALFMLLVFTTGQVAVAYDRCGDPECSITLGDQKQEKQQKADTCTHHCCSTHAMNEVRDAVKTPSIAAATVEWPDAQQLASATTPTLLEPPSTL